MRRFFLAGFLPFAALAVFFAPSARAQSLPNVTIDDFTAGPATVSIAGAKQTAEITKQVKQSGAHAHILGGGRLTSLELLLGNNVFLQNADITIAEAHGTAPAAVVFGQGFGVDALFGLNYGSARGPGSASFHANFTGYDRFRVHFIGISAGIDMNILAYTGAAYTQWGCNIPGLLVPTVVDFPFVNGSPGLAGSGGGANLAALDGLLFESENESVQASALGISLIEIVPAGTPAGDITCPPIGG